VVVGMILAHLIAWERQLIYEKKEVNSIDFLHVEIRKEVLRRWELEGDEADVGRWTWRLIRDVRSWINR